MQNSRSPVFSRPPLSTCSRAFVALVLVLAFDVAGSRSAEAGSGGDTVAQVNGMVCVSAAADDHSAMNPGDDGASATRGNDVDHIAAHPTLTPTPMASGTTTIMARTWMTQMEGQQEPSPPVQNDDDGSQQRQQQPDRSDDDDKSDEDED